MLLLMYYNDVKYYFFLCFGLPNWTRAKANYYS